jgi:recombination protein RecA
MKEADRRHVIHRKVAAMQPQASGVLPTGFRTLDDALGGGWPRGRIVEMFGPSSSGKTTLAYQTIAHLQAQGGSAAWIDADHTFDPGYAASLGMVVERVPVAQPDSAEQALEIACRLAASQAIDLLVLDSAAALVPHLELTSSLGESGSGLQSRVLASGLRRLARAATKSETAVVFLNQTRSKWDPSAGETETSAGGAPLKMFAALRIALAPGAGRVRIRVVKNKAAEAFQEAVLLWKSGYGFSKSP